MNHNTILHIRRFYRIKPKISGLFVYKLSVTLCGIRTIDHVTVNPTVQQQHGDSYHVVWMKGVPL